MLFQQILRMTESTGGGTNEEVYKALEKEIAQGPEYGLRNNYAKIVVYPLAGDRFHGDLSKFERLGIKVDYSRNVKFMQVPKVGSQRSSQSGLSKQIGLSRRY